MPDIKPLDFKNSQILRKAHPHGRRLKLDEKIQAGQYIRISETDTLNLITEGNAYIGKKLGETPSTIEVWTL